MQRTELLYNALNREVLVKLLVNAPYQAYTQPIKTLALLKQSRVMHFLADLTLSQDNRIQLTHKR